MTALTWPSYSTGSTMTLRGCGVDQARCRCGWRRRGTSREQQALALHGALADQALAEAIAARLGRLAHVGVAGELLAGNARPSS